MTTMWLLKATDVCGGCTGVHCYCMVAEEYQRYGGIFGQLVWTMAWDSMGHNTIIFEFGQPAV